ncbi:mitochondrial splicing system protein [Friedmanniomyces endolithicus]|nr:mitochondrial splicing system protein [Friedmanniomyces endolithicus]KAK1815162.1 mitochondrial splicing system protein [Friedmanniomyces endolithicus]
MASLCIKHKQPTIYALSTAPGRAAIAVIRISGPACLDIYRALCPGKQEPKPRYATVRTLYESKPPVSQDSVQPTPATQVLDPNALILYFPAPRTATGEDVLELHLHGGPAVVKAVLSAIPRCASLSTQMEAPRIRYAEPGEFTRRAFLNERLDLTQVEALGDVLAATTEQQRRLSVRGTTGGLAKRYEAWRQQLLYARGELEALIDFSEDQHFDESPSELCASVAGQVRGLRGVLDVHRRNAVRGEMLRSGIGIALLGAPNAGKSSLLNGIVGREAAIVSREAGTTRDVVEIGIDLGGYLCRLGDTAGLRRVQEGARSASGEVSGGISLVEQEGMRRAKARAAESDVVLLVLSLEDVDGDGSVTVLLDPETVEAAAELIRTKDNVIVVLNKTDKASAPHLATATQQILQTFPGLTKPRIYPISCKTASETSTTSTTTDAGGIQTLLRGLISHFHDLTTALTPSPTAPHSNSAEAAVPDPSTWEDSLGATERHRLLLENCIAYLDAFLAEVEIGIPTSDEQTLHPSALGGDKDGEADIVLAAEHLRGAGECLAKITGRGGAGDVEEVLGVVFEKFCVGK